MLGLSLVTAAGLLYRALMLSSELARRWKLGSEVIPFEGEGSEDKEMERIMAINLVAKSHRDFFLFETFRRNNSDLVVRQALLAVKRLKDSKKKK